MKYRFILFTFIFFCAFSFLYGQNLETNGNTEENTALDLPNPFPLGTILLTTSQKNILWNPNWDIAIPPDAFTVLNRKPISITLLVNEGKYNLVWDRKGFLAEFPILLNGSFAQVKVFYNNSGVVRGFLITEKERVWQVDFIGKEILTSIARITQDETIYFVALSYNPTNIIETWFSVEGNMLANFTIRSVYTNGNNIDMLSLISYVNEEETTVWYYYNSFGYISEIEAQNSVFSVLYTQEKRPRYWKQSTEDGQKNYVLQWDNRGFLNRIYNDDLSELYYEYTLDNRGNWIERREVRMVPQGGILVPYEGLTIKRLITYQ